MGRRPFGICLVITASFSVVVGSGDHSLGAVGPDFGAVVGELGDIIANARTTVFDDVSVSFVGGDPHRLSVVLDGPDGGITVEMFEPPGRSLDVGFYQAGPSVPAADRARLSVSRSGMACGEGSGSFQIVEIQRSLDLTVTSLVVRWNVRCAGAVGTNSGMFRMNSDHPVAAFEIRPSIFDFGSQVVRTASPAHRIDFVNVGLSPTTITGVGQTTASPLDFEVTSNSCEGAIVLPGRSCSLVVEYTPTVDGPVSATFEIFDSVFRSAAGGTTKAIVAGEGVPAGGANSGEFTGVTPARILDTRSGVGVQRGTLGPRSWTKVRVTGRGGVPSSGVDAVVMNVTAVRPTSDTYVSIVPSFVALDPGEAEDPPPEVSNLNPPAGSIVANMVTVAIDRFDGTVSAYNDRGRTHLLFDVVGYYSTELGPDGARYVPLDPTRLFDTRDGGEVPKRPVGPDGSLRFDVGATLPELGSVLPDIEGGPTAVVLNVTVARPTASSFLTVHPGDVDTPTASNLNYSPGQRVANLVTVRLPANGVVQFHNEFGAADVVVDLVGMYLPGEFVGGRFTAETPSRRYDSRRSALGSLGPGENVAVEVVTPSIGSPAPREPTAVVANVTAVRPTEPGFFTVFPDDLCEVPGTSTVNFGPGEVVANSAIVAVSVANACSEGEGWIDIYNQFGHTDVLIDTFGYFS